MSSKIGKVLDNRGKKWLWVAQVRFRMYLIPFLHATQLLVRVI